MTSVDGRLRRKPHFCGVHSLRLQGVIGWSMTPGGAKGRCGVWVSQPASELRSMSRHWWGFARHEALWPRVVGVSDPHVVQFPPIAGAVAASAADVVPKVQTISVGNAQNGLFRVRWSVFWPNGVSHGVRGWADAPVGECAHERICVWGMGCVCEAAGWAFVKAPCRRQNKNPEAYASGSCWWLRPASIR